MSIETLSERERMVFDGIAAGSRITDIAKEASLSVKTVSTYRYRLCKKLNINSNAEIGALAKTLADANKTNGISH